MENQLTLVPSEQLPQTDPAKKLKPRVNCLGDVLRELMDERGLKDADVVRATGVPFSTWHGWITNDVNTQLADQNLFKVFKFFNVPLHYLIYGVGEAEPVFNDNDEDQPA